MSDYLQPDESTVEATEREALRAARREFEGLEIEPEPQDVMLATLRAFSAVKQAFAEATDAFRAAHPEQKCHRVYCDDPRHIVLSAFCTRDEESDYEVHPYSIAGSAWIGVIDACIALHTAWVHQVATEHGEHDQLGDGLSDSVLAEMTSKASTE